MIRAELAVAAIALVATVAVASAQAQTQTASLEPTIWDHNGSVMYLVANGPSREFHYQKPRAGMLEVGVRPGSLLFRGEIDNGQYSGTAIFLIRIADKSRSRSKDRFSTTMNGFC
jgi:hypothetical protein